MNNLQTGFLLMLVPSIGAFLWFVSLSPTPLSNNPQALVLVIAFCYGAVLTADESFLIKKEKERIEKKKKVGKNV